MHIKYFGSFLISFIIFIIFLYKNIDFFKKLNILTINIRGIQAWVRDSRTACPPPHVL